MMTMVDAKEVVEDVVVVELNLTMQINHVVTTVGPMVMIIATDLTFVLILPLITIMKLHIKIAWAVQFATRADLIQAADF